jgi:hypothetical protein|tara:strand:+ start:79 stop:621 length:543 start_codon:yes stop_codon:yes gene_type:complete
MALTLISTHTADGSTANIDITSGIDDTYDSYEFHFVNIHPSLAGGSGQLLFQVNASGASGFNETITSTAFRAYKMENDDGGAVDYRTGEDQAQGTAYEIIMEGIQNDNDTSGSGILTLYAPSSTTYVKHFISVANTTLNAGTKQDFHAGYINTTSAITQISFKTSSGTMDAGTIKMFGVS